MKKILMSLLLVLTVFVSSATAIQQTAVIATRVVDGNPALAGSEFSVLFEVSDNDTGKIPIGCAFRVHYSLNSVSFVSVTEGDLGSIMFSGEESDAGGVYRDILTMSNFSNTSLTPNCFTVTFRVNDSPNTPYSIWAEDDPDNQALLDSSFLEIVHGYDNSATIDMAQTLDPSPTPVISTSIYSGDPNTTGSTFTVKVAVSDNPNSDTYIGAALRIHYATEALSFTGVSYADLGNIFEGPEEFDGTSAFRDFLTMSNSSNTSLTPTILYVSFQVHSATPYSITMSKDPKNDVLITDIFDPVEAAFDSSATEGFDPVAGPTYTPTDTPTKTPTEAPTQTPTETPGAYNISLVSTDPPLSTILVPGSTVTVVSTVNYSVTGDYGSVYLGSMLLKSTYEILANSSLQALPSASGTLTTSVTATVPDNGIMVLKFALVNNTWDAYVEKMVTFAVVTPTPTPNEWYDIDIISTSPSTTQALQAGYLYDIGVTFDMDIVAALGTGAYLHMSLWTNSGLLKQTDLVFYSSSRTGITRSISAFIPDEDQLILRVRLVNDGFTVLAEDSRVFDIIARTPTVTPTPTPTVVSGVDGWKDYQ